MRAKQTPCWICPAFLFRYLSLWESRASATATQLRSTLLRRIAYFFPGGCTYSSSTIDSLTPACTSRERYAKETAAYAKDAEDAEKAAAMSPPALQASCVCNLLKQPCSLRQHHITGCFERAIANFRRGSEPMLKQVHQDDGGRLAGDQASGYWIGPAGDEPGPCPLINSSRETNN